MYLGSKVIKGAPEFLELLPSVGSNFLMLTNNSSKNSQEYQKKLASFGCNVSQSSIFTSGEATALYLQQTQPDASIYLLGTATLKNEFEKHGLTLHNGTSSSLPDIVVVGFDTTLTYEKLNNACRFLSEGAQYVATHPDFICPLEKGTYMPDIGCIINFIKTATQRTPTVIGKPHTFFIDVVTKRFNIPREAIAIVGDRLYTDIKMGVDSGITSILMLSGDTSEEEYNNASLKADYVFNSIKELGEAVRNAHSR